MVDGLKSNAVVVNEAILYYGNMEKLETEKLSRPP